MPRPRRRRLPALALATALAGCAAAPHHTGETQLETRAHYSVPLVHRSLFWDGGGDIPNAGGSIFATEYVTDYLALGAGATLTNWFRDGADAQSAEGSVLARVHPFESLPLFWQGTGGFQQASRNIPDEGTEWNFSFSFGPGMEMPVGDHESLLVGVDYHHISNALGRQSARNPSQNETRFWIGFSWTF